MSKQSIGSRREAIDPKSDIAIQVRDLHKTFQLPTERAWGLKQAIFNRLKGVKGFTEQKVLDGINLEVKKANSLVSSVVMAQVNQLYSKLLLEFIILALAMFGLMVD